MAQMKPRGMIGKWRLSGGQSMQQRQRPDPAIASATSMVQTHDITTAGAIPEQMNSTTKRAGAREEGEAGGGLEGEIRILYQNVRRGEDTHHLVLQLAVEKRAVVVAVAEPWGGEGRRKQQAGFEIAYDSKYLVVYKLRGREIEVKGMETGRLLGRRQR